MWQSARGSWDVGILGPLTVASSGRPLALGSPQQRAVLAVLVCHAGRVVSLRMLVDALWGDVPVPAAHTSIQTHVSHLRQILEPDRPRGAPSVVLVTETGGYRLAVEASAVDATRFEAMVSEAMLAARSGKPEAALRAYEAALSLWRGEVLADLAAYAFQVPVAARLDELRASAEEGRVQALLDLERLAPALAELDRLLAEHPLREGLHAQRMLALYRAGRQFDALETYRMLRARLDDQLGVAPSPAVKELHRRILGQDPALLGETTPSALRSTTPSRTSAAPRREGVAPDAGVAGPTPLHAEWPGSRASDPRPVRQRRRALIAILVCAALAGSLFGARVSVAPTRTLDGNTVGVLDATGQVVGAVQAGTQPVGIAYGGGVLWVVSQSDATVLRIDPVSSTVTQRFDVGHDPSAVAAGVDDVWVANFGGWHSHPHQHQGQPDRPAGHPCRLAADGPLRGRRWCLGGQQRRQQRAADRRANGPAGSRRRRRRRAGRRARRRRRRMGGQRTGRNGLAPRRDDGAGGVQPHPGRFRPPWADPRRL